MMSQTQALCCCSCNGNLPVVGGILCNVKRDLELLYLCLRVGFDEHSRGVSTSNLRTPHAHSTSDTNLCIGAGIKKLMQLGSLRTQRVGKRRKLSFHTRIAYLCFRCSAEFLFQEKIQRVVSECDESAYMIATIMYADSSWPN